jgi:hypothetical protein
MDSFSAVAIRLFFALLSTDNFEIRYFIINLSVKNQMMNSVEIFEIAIIRGFNGHG